MFLLQSREPTYTKGNYRLNFHGRVTVPSVKNFQLVSPDDKLHTVCQFGKVIYGRIALLCFDRPWFSSIKLSAKGPSHVSSDG